MFYSHAPKTATKSMMVSQTIKPAIHRMTPIQIRERIMAMIKELSKRHEKEMSRLASRDITAAKSYIEIQTSCDSSSNKNKVCSI